MSDPVRTGTATLWAGVGLLVAGLFFGSPAVEVPGVALLALTFGLRTWVVRAARRLRLATVPGHSTAIEGEPYDVHIHIDGTGRLSPGGWIEHPRLAGTRVELGMPLPPEAHFELRLERRGRHSLGAPTLVVADPLGQREARIEGEDRGRVLVLPRIEPVERPGRDGAGDGIAELGALESLLDGTSSARSAGVDVDIDGLRPHRPGSPSSRIHWPTVARTGEMYERLLVANAEGGPLVVLDSSNPASAEALDCAVRAAASLCMTLARVSGCSLSVSGRDRPFVIDRGLRAWPAAHAALALVEPARAAPITRSRRTDVAFWVTAAALASAPASGVGQTTFIVSPSPPSTHAPAFTVAGCTGWLATRSGARRQAIAA
jgi:uncharacterized protein (DUF58 family)